jgi:hypothetical protein
MDDNDLETEFRKLPIPCLVLMDDIDASSADVGNRALPVETKLQDMAGELEQFDKSEAVDLINQTLGQWHNRFDARMKQVDANNNAVLRFMEEHIGNNSDSSD